MKLLWLINDFLLMSYLAGLIAEVEGISLEDEIYFTLGSWNENWWIQFFYSPLIFTSL